MSEVPRIRTPLSPADLVDVLAHGHAAALGEAPGENRLRLAWAQCMLENGRGRWIWCNNIGNITASKTYGGDYYVDHVQERVKRNPDEWRWFDLRFRAHASPEAGAADYWRRMDHDFAPALPFFDAGDIHSAVVKLSELVYFTARVEPYERAVTLLAREFDEALWDYPG